MKKLNLIKLNIIIENVFIFLFLMRNIYYEYGLTEQA
jgi:hypothetical protein